jgi:hypothetical protein
MKKLRPFLIQFLGTAVLFSALVGAGTCLVLLAASSFGYLPYSDRPGPGWYSHAHFPTWEEVRIYFGFTSFFAYFVFFQGCVIYVLSLILNLSKPPRWLVRTIGGIVSFLAAGLAVLGAGWYIALAPIGSYAAATIGLLYGIFLFPKSLHPRTKELAVLWRYSLTSAASLSVIGWLLFPLLPRKPVPEINYQLDRLVSSEERTEMTVPSWLGTEIPIEASKLGLHGTLHSGIGGAGASSDSSSINILLIAQEPIRQEYSLELPAQGYVVYTLQNGAWTPHPALIKKDKRRLRVLPGLDPKFEGGRTQIGDSFDPTPFTWYPTIPR